MSSPARDLWCPACDAVLGRRPETLCCAGCGRSFPVIGDIPDLRLSYDDPYVSWAEDLDRARRLQDLSGEVDFGGLIEEHWRQSGKPVELARRFLAGDLASMQRSRAYLASIERQRGRPLGTGERFLEVGCGTAGMAGAAAERGAAAVATDASMRWLVLARKRLADLDVRGVELVCCDGERSPFAEGFFGVITASDVIEHTADPDRFVAGCTRVLAPGGTLFLATPNRFSLTLEPHVRLWGVGWLPLPIAKRYVQAVRGTPYEHVRLQSAKGLRRSLVAQGLAVEIIPPEIPPATESLYAGVELRLVRAYNRVRRRSRVRRLLLLVGPFFHAFARKPIR